MVPLKLLSPSYYGAFFDAFLVLMVVLLQGLQFMNSARNERTPNEISLALRGNSAGWDISRGGMVAEEIKK